MSAPVSHTAKPTHDLTRRSRLFELIRQQDHAQQVTDRRADTLQIPTDAMRLFALQAGASLRAEPLRD